MKEWSEDPPRGFGAAARFRTNGEPPGILSIERIQLQHSGLYRYCQNTALVFGILQVLTGYSSSIWDSTCTVYWQDTAAAFGTLQVLTGYSGSIRDSTGIDMIQRQHSGLYRYWQDTAPAFGTLQSTGIDRIQLQHPGLYRYWQDTAPAFGTLHWVYRYCQDTAAPAFGTLQVLTGYSCQLCQIVIWHQFPNFTLKYWF